MVQIKLPGEDKETLGGGDTLLPTTDPEVRRGTLEIIAKRKNRDSVGSFSTTLLVIMAIIFTLTTVKQICDLKEQNIRLIQQLALERQKDAALKLAVRDNIPANKFIQHRFNSVEAGLVEAEGKLDQPNSSWTINLSVLWTSPIITPCDMARLSHILAEEIYAHQEDLDQKRSWSDETEADEKDIKKELLTLASALDAETVISEMSSEEWDSSEEMTSDELYFLKMDSLGNNLVDLTDDLALNVPVEYFWNDDVSADSDEFQLLGEDSDEMNYYY